MMALERFKEIKQRHKDPLVCTHPTDHEIIGELLAHIEEQNKRPCLYGGYEGKTAEDVYQEFWAGLVEVDGVVDVEQVKKELYDFYVLMCEVPKVYMHVSGSRVSKPNTMAFEVISLSDEHCTQVVEEETKELREHIEVLGGVFDSLKTAITTSANDFSLHKGDAWIYGLVVGWGECLDKICNQFGWDEATKIRLMKYRGAVCMAQSIAKDEANDS